jgi:hypothetical protein
LRASLKSQPDPSTYPGEQENKQPRKEGSKEGRKEGRRFVWTFVQVRLLCSRNLLLVFIKVIAPLVVCRFSQDKKILLLVGLAT